MSNLLVNSECVIPQSKVLRAGSQFVGGCLRAGVAVSVGGLASGPNLFPTAQFHQQRVRPVRTWLASRTCRGSHRRSGHSSHARRMTPPRLRSSS